MQKTTITPLLAKAILEKNANNRKIRKDRVDRYASDMSRGDFRFCFSPLIFGKNGILLDGQHRLLAVVKSGLDHDFYCVYTDFEDFRQLPIDIGSIRSSKDYAIGGKRAAAVAGLLLECCNYNKTRNLSPLVVASVADSVHEKFNKFCVSSASASLSLGAISHFCLTGDDIGLIYARAIKDERYEDLPKNIANWNRWRKNNPEAVGFSVVPRIMTAISFLQALSNKDGKVFRMYQIKDGEFQKNAKEKIADPVFSFMKTTPPKEL
jgi:hypothetical protein